MNSKSPLMVYTKGDARGSVGEAHLWVCSGKNIGRRFALDKPDMVIGRSSSADIPVVDERVSQQHALIETRDDGHYLRDLGSTNGCFVNNQRTHEAHLRDGDLIQVGETVFEYLSYQERNLTITLRGTNKDSDAVPAALRAEARQMLEQARVLPQPHVATAPDTSVPSSAPGRSGTVDVPAMDPAATGPVGMHSHMPPIQRPARDIGGPPPGPHHTGPSATTPGGFHPAPLPVPYGFGYPQPHHPPPHAQHGLVPHVPGGPMAPPPLEERSAVVVDEGDEDEGEGFSVEFLLARLQTVKSIFAPYWKSMVLIVVLGIAGGVAMFKKSPPMQTAEFEVALIAQTSTNPLHPYWGQLKRFFVGAEANFTSPTLIEKTLVELGNENPSPALLNSTSAALTLVSAGPPTPDTYTGTFVHKDGDWALTFLETHVRLYLESEVEKALKVLKNEAAFLGEQVEEMEKQLRRTEAELMEFKKKNIDSQPGNNDAYSRLITLRINESKAVMDLMKARKTRAMLRKRLATEQPLVKTKLRFDDHYKREISNVQLKLIQEKAAGKGPDHPEIVKLEKRLAELQARSAEAKDDPTSFETARNPVHMRIQNEERNVQIQEQLAQEQLAYVRREIKKTEEIVSTLPELEAEQAELMRSYQTTKDQYGKLLQQMQVVQVQLNLERASATARYDVISEPHLVYMNRTKKMVMYAIFGAVGGLVFAIGLSLLRWALREGKLAPILAMLKRQPAAAAASDSTALAPIEDAGGEMSTTDQR